MSFRQLSPPASLRQLNFTEDRREALILQDEEAGHQPNFNASEGSQWYSPIPTGDPDLTDDEHDKEDAQNSVLNIVVSSHSFQTMMALLIMGNSLVIGLETDNPSYPNWDLIENLFLAAFAAELVLRLYVLRGAFFNYRNADFSWNIFDFVVVSLGMVDALANVVGTTRSTGGVAILFRIIRLMRILRIFRIVRFLKQLYLLAYGLAEAAQAVFWVTILMAFVLYVCSIVLVRYVGHGRHDDTYDEFVKVKFGTILRCMLSLFELMASPNLPEYQMQGSMLWDHPLLAVFLVGFVIFGSFGMIALLTGVISESMFEKNQLRMEEDRQEKEKQRKAIHSRCEAMFNKLKLDEEGRAMLGDVEKLIPKVERMFEHACVDYTLDDIFRVVRLKLDMHNTISRDDFCDGIIALAGGVKAISLQELYSAIRCVEGKIDRLGRGAIVGPAPSGEGALRGSGGRHAVLVKKSSKKSAGISDPSGQEDLDRPELGASWARNASEEEDGEGGADARRQLGSGNVASAETIAEEGQSRKGTEHEDVEEIAAGEPKERGKDRTAEDKDEQIEKKERKTEKEEAGEKKRHQLADTTPASALSRLEDLASKLAQWTAAQNDELQRVREAMSTFEHRLLDGVASTVASSIAARHEELHETLILMGSKRLEALCPGAAKGGDHPSCWESAFSPERSPEEPSWPEQERCRTDVSGAEPASGAHSPKMSSTGIGDSSTAGASVPIDSVPPHSAPHDGQHLPDAAGTAEEPHPAAASLEKVHDPLARIDKSRRAGAEDRSAVGGDGDGGGEATESPAETHVAGKDDHPTTAAAPSRSASPKSAGLDNGCASDSVREVELPSLGEGDGCQEATVPISTMPETTLQGHDAGLGSSDTCSVRLSDGAGHGSP